MANAVLKVKRSVWMAHISPAVTGVSSHLLRAAGISANAWNFLTHCKYVALLQECFQCLTLGEEKTQ